MKYYLFQPDILTLQSVDREEIQDLRIDTPEDDDILILFDPLTSTIMLEPQVKHEYWFHVVNGELWEDVNLGMDHVDKYLNAVKDLRPSDYYHYDYSISNKGEKYYHAVDESWTCPSKKYQVL